MLGIILLAVFASMIPIFGIFVEIGVLVFLIISLVGAISEKKVLAPVVGVLFQDWFKSM